MRFRPLCKDDHGRQDSGLHWKLLHCGFVTQRVHTSKGCNARKLRCRLLPHRRQVSAELFGLGKYLHNPDAVATLNLHLPLPRTLPMQGTRGARNALILSRRLVPHASLFGVRQHLIRTSHLLEFQQTLFAPRVLVRMPSQGQFSVHLLDVRRRRRPWNVQGSVVICLGFSPHSPHIIRFLVGLQPESQKKEANCEHDKTPIDNLLECCLLLLALFRFSFEEFPFTIRKVLSLLRAKRLVPRRTYGGEVKLVI
mmetsp:Transcript_45997/g.90622  ORF Transcript_45997/g.90622 Transcript_45997/m.90622 type:complete len:253 (-) Transcript_45997:851-1609(-)